MIKNLKKITLSCLAVGMALVLGACGNSERQTAPEKQASETETGSVREYVYSASFQNINIPSEAKKAGILCMTENGYYTYVREKTGSSLREGEMPKYEGQGDLFNNYLAFCSFDGELNRLSGYTPLENFELNEEMYHAEELNYISDLHLLPDGKILSVEERSLSYADEPEISSDDENLAGHTHEQHETFARILAADGTEESRVLIESAAGAPVRITGVTDKDGNILVIYGSVISALKPDGTTAYEITCPGYPENVFRLADGEIVAYTYDNGWNFSVLDFAERSVGEIYSIGSSYASNISSSNSEYTLCFTSGSAFMGLNKETGEPETVFNWPECDVNSFSLGDTLMNQNGSVTALDLSEAYKGIYSLVTVAKVPYDPSAQKKELTFATQYLQPDVEAEIIRFNRSNPDCRIKVIDYSQYNTPDDDSAGIMKMKTEIMAGNIPDLIDLAGMPTDQMAVNGILEDLAPYIEADPEIELSDFFPNVLEGGKAGDKLVSTVSGFYIMTAIGASSVVGDEPGWTYDEFEEVLGSMPEGCTPFEDFVTQTDILDKCLQLDLDDFVDWDTGRVDFDNEEFIKLLRFAGSFKKTYDWETYGESGKSDSLENRLAEGRQMLINGYLMSFDYLLYEAATSFSGKDVTYIGYPTAKGETNGSMLGMRTGYAMSTSCKDKDAAWQFLRSFFSEEYMKTLNEFPASRTLFLSELEEIKKVRYEQDDDGNYLLDEKGERIPVVLCSYTLGAGQKEVPVYCMSEELADKVLQLADTTTKIANYDTTIPDMIREDVQAFFAGQKSAEEIAKLVQSKANIYVSEQR